MSTENLELFKSINIKNGQQELHGQYQKQETSFENFNRLGGFLQNGKFSWIAKDSILRVISTNSGVEVAYYNFAIHNRIEGCRINCVEEIKYLPDACIIAVCLVFQNVSLPIEDAGMVSIFCIQGSKILGSMDMSERITSCKALDWENCRRSALRQFHGTLAIGTNQGKLFLVDLMIPNDMKEIVLSPSYDGEIFSMTVIPMNEETDQIQLMHHHKKFVRNRETTREKSYFAILLTQVLDDSGSIISFLSMPSLLMMAIGLDDGRMVLYDLVELHAFHLAYPPGNQSPLTHMSYIEPADDPRSAVYIWAFHATKDGAIAVMHSIMFENRVNGYYENFRSCSVRLTMPIFIKDTFPVCCRSITKALTSDEDDIITINLLAWTSPKRNQTHIMIFDLNQWYKEEMPSVGDWRNHLKYTVVFAVPHGALDILLNEKSLMPFNSILRPEEHFYPNSLSFELVILEYTRFAHYHWIGIQNQVLQQFNIVGPKMILEPSYYFDELQQVAISPQFYDVTFSIASSIELKREFLLSVALEYNFIGFLKKCAWSWADGSYMGKNGNIGVSLSTLTEWIWKRVLVIKEISNSLCLPLFDFSEQRIDCGTQKQLALCCKQLKNLSDLLQTIIRDYQRSIPEKIQTLIRNQADSVKMASDYQEVLQWLLNVGLLPEGHHDILNKVIETHDHFVTVPFPYRAISSHYNAQRSKFGSNSEDFVLKNYLFIDAFIEEECCGDELIKVWEGLYPPKTIQSLLRILLVPHISLENKYVIFIYLFMDITNVLNESAYSTIVRNLIKFPAVFKISPSIIKRTQAFWNLDNGLMDTAVEELISPLSNDRFLPKWQRELLIGSLLRLNAPNLALRALRCPGNLISAELEMSTLLANNLISEALKIQRASGDQNLLRKFFHKVLHSSNYEQLLDLALTEDEGNVLRDYLQNTDLSNCMNVHFVYLLQRAKFIDAAQLMDSFNSSKVNISMEPPKQMLNAYYSVMEPTTRKLTSLAYADNTVHNAVHEFPSPLSVNLIHSRCNATNDIYKRCVQTITEATHNISQEVKEMPFIGMPKLGVFDLKPQGIQTQEIVYPIEFNEHGKRPKRDNASNEIFRMSDFEGPQAKRPRIENKLDSNKISSFANRRINLLTNFKKIRSQIDFTGIKTLSTSSRETPEKQTVTLFGETLNTPIVAENKTPIKKILPERVGTPQSILKTRSCRSSVSPAHSQVSTKSITFAAMPDTHESSLNDSSYLDESFGGADPVNSSAEIFYSPERTEKNDLVIVSSNFSIASGPKPRPPIKSRSNTPQNESSNQSKTLVCHLDQEEIEPINPSEVRAQSTHKILNQQNTEETRIVSNQDIKEISYTSSDSEDYETIKRKSVLHSSDQSDSESTSDINITEDSIYGLMRKSVLQTTQEDSSDDEGDEQSELQIERHNISSSSSNNSEENLQIAEDEHFEEEELPEHSDYDDDENISHDDMEYDEVDLDDSSSAESESNKKRFVENEVIELLDSDEEDLQIQAPISLPTFSEVHAAQTISQQILPPFNQIEQHSEIKVQTIKQKCENNLLELAIADNIIEASREPKTETEIIDFLYNNIGDQPKGDTNSTQFETISELQVNNQNEDVQDVEKTERENIQTEFGKMNENMDNFEDSPDDKIQSTNLNLDDITQDANTQDFSNNLSILQPQENIKEISKTSESILNQAHISELELTAENNTKLDENCVFGENINVVEQASSLSSINPEIDENPLEITKINAELRNQDESETFISATSDFQVDGTSKNFKQNPIEFTKKSDSDEEIISNTSENPLEMAPIAGSSRINVTEINEESDKHSSNSLNENITTLSEKEITDSTLNIAQCFINETASNKEKSKNNIKNTDDRKENTVLSSPAPNQEQQTIESSQTQTNPLDLSTTSHPNRSTRHSVLELKENEISTRNTRATSVPFISTSSSPPLPSRSFRASSEIHVNPKKILKDSILESIVESPRMLTRNKSRLMSQSSDKTPQTPTKISRTLSEDKDSLNRTPRRRSSASTPTPITPRRILTRATSKESIASSVTLSSSLHIDEKTPEEPTTSRGRGERKKKTASDDENDEVKSTKSGYYTSSQKKTKISTENSFIDELNASNRRLTRAQMAVLEKSRIISQRMSSSSLRRSISDVGPNKSDDGNHEDVSDTESVKSMKSGKSKESKASSRRSARKKKTPSRLIEYETLSVTSKSSRKSKSPIKKQLLSAIPEEDNDLSTLERTTRSRKK